MASIDVNGQEFNGESFSVKGGVLYIDGHAIADLKHDSDYIYFKGDGNCNIQSDKKIVVNDSILHGTLNADTIVINGDIAAGAILNAKKIIDNR